MATVCAKPFHAKVARFTRLDACGVPITGACSTLVTNGFITITNSFVYRDPTEIEVVNGNGDLCISELGKRALKRIEPTIALCEVDPDLINFLTADPIVLDDTAVTPNKVGYRVDTAVSGTGNFAMEVWTDLSGQPCTTGTPSYGYYLLPFLTNGYFSDDQAHQETELTVTIAANTKAGSGWGVGPYDVRTDATTDAPEPLLTAITATQHQHFEVVALAPPTAVCGCTELAA